jgi:large subunit ribosomal protein L16
MLSPKRTKFRKMQKGRVRGLARTGCDVDFGDFGLQVTECGWITARQIEAARIAMTRFTKRRGQIWIRVFPDKPITKKPAETRMGTGKGAVEYWVASVNAGRVLYEVRGVDEATAREAFRLAAGKLPLATRFTRRGEVLA